MAQGGDLTNGNGTGVESIYGKNFPQREFQEVSHESGVFSMAK